LVRQFETEQRQLRRPEFASLQPALDHAKAGDTILIAPGAYDQDLAARVSAARAANIIVWVVGA
jgi:hypothetical protein